ncbi:coiled-coil domain-containing protein 117 [Stegostoma tigrinum]|uniref:coiled-coil domain-containing protein 117 n=1 Tax=Stegostoma tigrinum TaxID=3053191 RepID=UPI00202B3D55|nr:coiled-coil domain-containing protein 117 [Stegostoma tigrinum]XP_048412328.1 coiled-coil domain-containing protein 117 [Stegostoma tigrinum]XP_048412329.1 coiled-coil domain-containing protein 117 [Stegostoma tigrinum]XP_048412330.1 coiled-coil domain-containing protein 117 [Stegostoma tigrinum]XP_048412331.1 coiled-coil domain-containing protein 117 [Stegostoma tigrinum]XP_048412332.1 coiled-coil domain-containing protein 117 [Stegostoma tigrinum]XP_048412333.1 coiled-coil domain-contain
MVMAHSLCYSSLTPSGRQLFQSPALEVYGRNAPCAAAHIQNPLCWQTDCFVPAHTSTTHLEGKGCKQGDGINESMDTTVESPENNPVLNAVRTTTANAELKNPPLRNEFFFRRKHKREQEEDDAPARKKRLTEKMLDCLVTSVNVSCSSWPSTFNPQESGISDVASPSWQIGPSSQEFRVIENEAAYVDMKPDPNEEGLQKLKEIENRLVEGDDPEGEGIEVSDMPVLVLSDSLREELRPGLEEILPRRIMESLNRPCMELVLWRPPCEPLSDKLAALTEQRNSKHRQPQCNPDVYNKSPKLDSSLMCGDMNLANTSEEDMEL